MIETRAIACPDKENHTEMSRNCERLSTGPERQGNGIAAATPKAGKFLIYVAFVVDPSWADHSKAVRDFTSCTSLETPKSCDNLNMVRSCANQIVPVPHSPFKKEVFIIDNGLAMYFQDTTPILFL